MPRREQSILFKRSWSTRGLAEAISEIDREDLWTEYHELRRCAPERHARGKKYFTGHCGTLSTAGGSHRFEEHLAIALWRRWKSPGGGRVRLLDYQVPLKARRSDGGIGKVDLLGVSDSGRLTVIELKVKPEDETRGGENPMAALIEGLCYSAIVSANQGPIAQEARSRFGEDISGEAPAVQILAPKGWWRFWLELNGSTRRAAGHWEREFAKLVRDVEVGLGVSVKCVALDDVTRGDITYGPSRRCPRIDRRLELRPVRPAEASPIGPPMPRHGVGARRE